MPWFLPVVLRIGLAHGIYPWISKHIVSQHSRTKRFFLNFLFAASTALAIALVWGKLPINRTTGSIFLVGFFNGIAAYCQWRAIAISLSRNSLFTFWDDVIGMSLSYFILHESQFLNWGSIAGILLSFGAVVLFAIRDYRRRPAAADPKSEHHIGTGFYLWVAVYSVIWGVATFMMRVWGLKVVHPTNFMAAWYGGALLAAFLILVFYRDPSASQQANLPFKFKDFGFVAIMGSLIMLSLALGYMSYERATA